jgi:hypothetical protein
MEQFWRDESEEQVLYPVVVTQRGAIIAAHRGVLEDLKYRLLEQYPDVVEDMEHCPKIATIRAAENAWLAIAKVAAVLGISDVEAR